MIGQKYSCFGITISEYFHNLNKFAMSLNDESSLEEPDFGVTLYNGRRTNLEKEIFICKYCPIHREELQDFKYRDSHITKNCHDKLSTALQSIRFICDIEFPAFMTKTGECWVRAGCRHMVRNIETRSYEVNNENYFSVYQY